MNEIHLSELNEAAGLLVELSGNKNKTYMITGASGTIGVEFVDILIQNNHVNRANNRIIAVGRNINKLEEKFAHHSGDSNFIIADYITINSICNIDYLVHAASITASSAFINDPIGVIDGSYNLAKEMLDYAVGKGVGRFIYISSVEAYGAPHDYQDIFTEQDCGIINTTNIRNSYPMVKNLCEMLVTAYHSQHKLDTIIVRPSKCYGMNYDINDKRMFSDFARKIAENTPIVLHTSGMQEFSYCYVMDAVIGIIYAATRGESGNIYNISNRESRATVRQVAEQFAFVGGGKVLVDILPDSQTGYVQNRHCVVDASKLERLGYIPKVSLREGIARLISYSRQIIEGDK